MRKNIVKIFLSALVFATGIYIFLAFGSITAKAETPLITTVEELTTALANAKDGDTVLVGNITFQPMPKGMINLSKSVTVKSGTDANAVFSNATLNLIGTTTDGSPLSVKFENIDFRGDKSDGKIDSTNASLVSSSLPDIMKTMYATSFTKNVVASYDGCTFEGYHYGYGGVFNAKYATTSEQQNNLRLELTDCVFRNNAGKYGGCLYLSGYDNNIRLDAKHCVFEENFATTGGVIWAENATLNLLDCALTKNTPMQTEIENPNGGALALLNCNAELNGCLISENSSLGKGAGIYTEIYPFKSVIAENCTFCGNSSSDDENIFVVALTTNYDTVPKIRFYFSSVFGKVGFLKENAETFGCLFVSDTAVEETPTTENGYNLYLPTDKVRETVLSKHYSLQNGEYAIPKEDTEKVAGGKFRNSFGKLQVGDNYVSEVTLTVERSSKNKETVVLRYGDELVLDTPERDGYAFDGWKDLNGTLFLGGELQSVSVVAKWNFQLSKNLYLVFVPLAVVVGALAVVVVVVMKKRKTPTAQTELAVSEPTNANDHIIKAWFTEEEISVIVSSMPEVQTLTRRETEVFTEILEGKKQKEIAYDLGVEITTVKDFYRKIYDKLGVKSREDLLKACSKVVSK